MCQRIGYLRKGIEYAPTRRRRKSFAIAAQGRRLWISLLFNHYPGSTISPVHVLDPRFETATRSEMTRSSSSRGSSNRDKRGEKGRIILASETLRSICTGYAIAGPAPAATHLAL